MRFKTHEEIDNHARAQGLDVDRLHKEFEQVRHILQNEQNRAIYFLKEKMGKIRFWFWDNISCFPLGAYLSYGFGYDGYVEKAKEYGFKDNINFATKEVLETDGRRT